MKLISVSVGNEDLYLLIKDSDAKQVSEWLHSYKSYGEFKRQLIIKFVQFIEIKDEDIYDAKAFEEW